MTGDIRKLTHAVPFAPFTIHLADGGHLRVPAIDHVAIAPSGGRVIVYQDDDSYQVLSGLLISRLSVDQPSSVQSALSTFTKLNFSNGLHFSIQASTR